MNTPKSSGKCENITVAKALGILLPMALLALLISALILSVFNDIYAFVKKDIEIAFTVDEPYSLSEFSRILQQKEVIKNPTVFKLYAIAKGKRHTVENFSGELDLNANMSYRQIFYALDQQNPY